MEEEEYVVEPNNVIINIGIGYTKAGLCCEMELVLYFQQLLVIQNIIVEMQEMIRKNFWLVQKRKINDKYLKCIIFQ